eukprot:782460-Pelagomonas_calceolata.AAC.1
MEKLLVLFRFQELLIEHGYDGGKPIDEKFYRARISGKLIGCRHNPEIAADLFPERPEEWRTWFYQTKEKCFRDMAGECLEAEQLAWEDVHLKSATRSKIRPLPGLERFMAWIHSRGIDIGGGVHTPQALSRSIPGADYGHALKLRLDDNVDIAQGLVDGTLVAMHFGCHGMIPTFTTKSPSHITPCTMSDNW